MLVQKLFISIFGVMVLCGIAIAQKTPVVAGVTGTKPLTTAADGPKLEMGSYLGVATTPASAALREQLKLKPGIGLIVEHINQGSPAEVAGLKQYDIIEKFNDQWMVSPEQLAVLIRLAEPNSEIKLSILHQGQPQILSAKLAVKELPVLSSLNSTYDPSIRYSVFKKGSGTVEAADPKDLGTMHIYLYKDPRQTGQMQVSSTSGEYVLTLTRENGKTHLSALNQADKSQVDRELNSEQDLNDLPPELAKRARQLLSTMKISLPTTLPAAR